MDQSQGKAGKRDADRGLFVLRSRDTPTYADWDLDM